MLKNFILVGVLKANVEYKDKPSVLLDLYVVKKGPGVDEKGLAPPDPARLVAIKSLKASQAPPIARERLPDMVSADHARQIL